MPPKWIRDPNTQRDYYVDANGRSRWRDEGQNQQSGSGQVPRVVIPERADSYNYPGANQPQPYGTPSQTSYGQPRPTAVPPNASQRVSSDAVNTLAQGVGRMTVQPGYQQPQFGNAQQQAQQNPAAIPRTYQSYQRSGIDYLDITDNGNQVRTIVQTGPPRFITPNLLANEGLRSHMNLLGTDGEAERLFQSFRKRNQPRKFFTVGKVFLVLWSEPAGATVVSVIEKGTSYGRFGEAVFSKVRRFIVIREGETFCAAIPITTYSGRGLAKEGTTKYEHGIVHTGREAPKLTAPEAAGRNERPIQPDAIRVDTDDPKEKLDTMSRVDYGKVYTIEHNVKVKALGAVHPKSMNSLLHQFRNVWADSSSPKAAAAGKAGPGTTSVGVQTQKTPSASQDTTRSTGKSVSSGKTGQGKGGQVATTSSEGPRRGSQASNEALAQQARALAKKMVDDGWSPEEATEFARNRFQQSVARSDGGAQEPDQSQTLTQREYQLQESSVVILSKNGYSRQQAIEYIWGYVRRFMRDHNYSREQALVALQTNLNRSQGS